MTEPHTCTIPHLLAAGGAARIALLQYSVRSLNTAPLFVFLCGEYRLRPGHANALALYDLFCAPRAPVPTDATGLPTPVDLALTRQIESLRRQWHQLQLSEPPAPGDSLPITTPMRGLFDPVADALSHGDDGPLARISRIYDPALTPTENLPGRAMTPGQRQFVDYVWKPVVRPRLVAVGFWQLQTIE